MRFTWDPAKNERNIRLRGLDFADAAVMWDAPRVDWVDSRRDYGEIRRSVLGLVGDRVMFVGWVQRPDDVVHIFSFRRANARETRRYRTIHAAEDGCAATT